MSAASVASTAPGGRPRSSSRRAPGDLHVADVIVDDRGVMTPSSTRAPSSLRSGAPKQISMMPAAPADDMGALHAAFAASSPTQTFCRRLLQIALGPYDAVARCGPRPAGAREWYARQAIAQGWSRAMLAHHIDTNLYGRQGLANTNFTRTLPAPQSDLAQQVLKDPLQLRLPLPGRGRARRGELERGLMAHIREFLLELRGRLRVPGQPVSPRRGRRTTSSTLLPSAPALLRGHRPQDGGVRAGVRGHDELVSLGGGRPCCAHWGTSPASASSCARGGARWWPSTPCAI